MTELSYAQALSVVGQIETELTVLDQQKRALHRVADLLEKARDAERLLASLDAEAEAKKVSLTDLEVRYADRNAVLHSEHQSYTSTLTLEEASARSKMQAIREELIRVESNLAERERIAQNRISAVEGQITAKEEELVRVTEAFENFKKQYNLGG